MCGVLFAVVVVYAWAVVVHDSLGNALAYSQGKRVLIDNPVLIVPAERKVHAASLTIRNLGPAPVRILGTDKGCGCISTEPFPVDIPANGSRPIRLTVDLSHLAGDKLDQRLVFHTSHPVNPRLIATIRTPHPIPPGGARD